FKLHIAWIPGHMGVEGNEAVDEEAKAAAQGKSSELPPDLNVLLHPPRSLAALRAAYKKRVAAEWEEEWTMSRAGKRHTEFDKTPP
ncbi:hypothetical protein B0H12DRAFT_998339, partial [Mycena haematopus]